MNNKHFIHSDNIHEAQNAYYPSSKIDISNVVDKDHIVRAINQNNFAQLQSIAKSDPWKTKPPTSFHGYQEWLKKIDKHTSKLILNSDNNNDTNNDKNNDKNKNKNKRKNKPRSKSLYSKSEPTSPKSKKRTNQ